MDVKFLPSYYEDLEREVRELAQQLSPVLTLQVRGWIAEWIDVGEYGLAVTAMLEYLPTNADGEPRGALDHVREVALRIGLDDEVAKYWPRG